MEKLKDIIYEDLSENTPFKLMKNEFGESWRSSCKKVVNPKEHMKRIEDYTLPVNNSKRRFFSTLENGYPDCEEAERTFKIF